MSRKSTKPVSKQEAVEGVLWALLHAFAEVYSSDGVDNDGEKYLRDASFYALYKALLSAKLHVSKKFLGEFISSLLFIADWEEIRSTDSSYFKTYKSIIEEITS